MSTQSAHKAVIFDLDGTLVDSLGDLADSTNTVLARRGFPVHELDEYRYFVGDGMLNLILRALPEEKAVPSFARELHPEIDAEYSSSWHNRTRPYAGIPELLSELSSRGIRLAVLSNKPDHFTKQIVSYFFPDIPFSPVFGYRDGIPRKPDPTAALDIVKTFGLLKTEVLYLGDTNTDMRTANAAELYAVGASWGFRPIEELADSGAQAIIDNPLQLLDLL